MRVFIDDSHEFVSTAVRDDDVIINDLMESLFECRASESFCGIVISCGWSCGNDNAAQKEGGSVYSFEHVVNLSARLETCRDREIAEKRVGDERELKKKTKEDEKGF